VTNTLLNISQKIDPLHQRLIESIFRSTTKMEIPFVIVGAYARDIIFYYIYGAHSQRRTSDIDFGIMVENWDCFNNLKNYLFLNEGFKKGSNNHRIFSADGIPVDIVPFGSQIENQNSTIKWPPQGDTVMNVLGFKEAYEHSLFVVINESQNISVRVVSPEGLTFLKFISWDDRDHDIRKKDALDLKFIFEQYSSIPIIEDEIWEDEKLTEIYDFDLPICGVHLLGLKVCSIANQSIFNRLNSILSSNKFDYIIDDMTGIYESNEESNIQMMTAFKDGFYSEKSIFKI
jgi:predicted nucleotidyltransferase